jgi:DDE superfamily endonuclease/Helix-turn-helix of DDE superfamily endonuclease
MITYSGLQKDRRRFLALTGLTLKEFQALLGAFRRSYERLYPPQRTLAGRPRRRAPGGGRHGALHPPEQKLLLLLVYLKAYPLQVVMAELFALSQQGVNYWLHRLLPVLRLALDELGVLPQRSPGRFAHSRPPPEGGHRLIIDGTERRRHRPKGPEKQALHYSGKRKAHTDKNVVIVRTPGGRVEYLSRTYPGTAHEKRIAEHEGIAYPPDTVLYKDSGFQGYEPPVQQTRQPKKKGARERAHPRGEAQQPKVGEGTGQGRAWAGRGEAGPQHQGHLPQHQGGRLRCRPGGRLRAPQPARAEP